MMVLFYFTFDIKVIFCKITKAITIAYCHGYTEVVIVDDRLECLVHKWEGLHKDQLDISLLRQSFYPFLKEDANEAASIGHKLEKPLFQIVPSLKAAFWFGLVK